MTIYYQTRETACRRILASVVAAWWAPVGWAFRVDYEADSHMFWLKATYVDAGRRYEQRMHYTEEHIVNDHSDSGEEMLRRKTQDAYRKALQAVGKEP